MLAIEFRGLLEGVAKGFRNDLRVFKDISTMEQGEEAARNLVNPARTAT